ncbi:MAG: hypothetical protein JWN60_2482 [Acidobacteria bacterium]|jgi:hypothetical protein|nr:hypothetical protein [Acidobacteriota bacterium]
MKKHVVGFALFALITLTSLLVFSEFKLPESVNEPVFESKESEQLKNKNYNLEIRQVLFNSETGLFGFEIRCKDKPKEVLLKFYEKEADKTELIGVERINFQPSSHCKNGSTFFKTFDWSSDINPGANLYVIVENEQNTNNSEREFDESQAVPVLVSGNKISF